MPHAAVLRLLLALTLLSAWVVPAWAGPPALEAAAPSGRDQPEHRFAPRPIRMPLPPRDPRWPRPARPPRPPLQGAPVGDSPGELLQAIITDKTVTPYPTFSGNQARYYAYLVQQFNDRFTASVTDLRTQVYPNPLTYAPSNVFSIVSQITAPTGLDPTQQADWTAMHKQVQAELSSLTNLLQYQSQFAAGSNALATDFNSRFGTAQSTLVDGESGVVSFLTVLGGIVSLGSVNPEQAPLAVITGAYLTVAKGLAGSDRLTGDMSSLQTQLNALVEKTSATAETIYGPIAADWGKLQRFQALANRADSSPSMTPLQLAAAGDAYERSIYHSVIPSTMAVVSYYGADVGACGVGQDSGLALIPLRSGLNGKNERLCGRLWQIGVAQGDVLNRTGAWAALPWWGCGSSRFGTSCARRP